MPRAPHIPPEDKGSSLALWVLILCLVGAALLVVLCCPGCAPVRPVAVRPTTQPATSLVFSQNIAHATTHWLAPAERRFGKGKVFIVVGHGYTDSKSGRWMIHADDGQNLDVETVARVLSEEHPSQALLFIVCNEDRHTLHQPLRNVYYGNAIVWSMPDVWFPGKGVSHIEQFHN